jgi:glutathione S-transferase
MYRFYHSPGSSSFAVHIALQEAGAPFEGRTISFQARENDPPELRALNPEGKVPVLVADGVPVTEVAACLWYLARAHPGAGLLPAGGPLAEARAISWMSFVASTLHPSRRFGTDAQIAAYRHADARLGQGPWALGDAYCIADIHLFRLFWRFGATMGIDRATFPNLCAHYDRMMARPAVQAALAAEAAIGYALP